MDKIEWNKVTWYSQTVAVVLFVGVFFVGYGLGKRASTTADAQHTSETPLMMNQASTTMATMAMANLISDVTFTCSGQKSVEAKFYPAKVDLTLSDNRIMSVPQTHTKLGARYANADQTFVFMNRGNVAYVWENGTTTFSNCITK